MKATEIRTRGGTRVRCQWIEGSAYFGESAFDLHVRENGRRNPLILGFVKPAPAGHGWEGRIINSGDPTWQWFPTFDEATQTVAHQALARRYGQDNLP